MELSDATLWLLGGALLMGGEALLAPGVGFLFAGLGAITVGVALMAGLTHSPTGQATWFFVTTTLWAAVLWAPLRSMYNSKGSGYSDMVGSTAIVGEKGLDTKGKGNVRWSGATMTARLDPQSGVAGIDAGAEVIITRIEKGVLLVAPRSENE